MDKKQQKALKIIRKMQKKMDEARKKHDEEEVERLRWTITNMSDCVWVENFSVPTQVIVGYDFSQKKGE